MHECRDSACQRPFGVRRNAAGVCSEMTQWVWRIAGYTPFVGMLLNQCINACSAAILNQYLILLQCLISLQCLINTIMLLQRTYIVPFTQKSPHCVILSGAAQRRDGERESQPLPRSRTPKGRQQAESRHSRRA